MVRVWIDIKNSHEPAFFRPFLKNFSDHEFIISSRKYAEIQSLLDRLQIDHKVVGKHYGGNKVKKMAGLAVRDALLFLKIPGFGVSLSHGSINAIHAAKMRLKTVISFTDNETASLGNKISFRFVDYLITPNAVPINSLVKEGAKKDNLIQFNGFKEDIYLADFKPDPEFLSNLPFDDFITLRPEALQAAYVKETRSIVPDLIKAFNKEGVNVLYLPRYNTDRTFAKGSNVFMPPAALNGLDICYYSNAILTGSGTFAREAACMGTPAVSFYPEKLLAVDQRMVDDGKIFHSRDPEEIADYVLSSKKRVVDISRSKRVQKEVFTIFGNILRELEAKK